MPNTKRYWLRGAIIGLVFALMVVGLFTVSGLMSGDRYTIPPSSAAIFLENASSYASQINYYLDFIHPVVCKLSSCGGWVDLTGLYTIWPSYILLGAVGGLIYKKIKHRRTTGKWS